jgi:hypothetical protein
VIQAIIVCPVVSVVLKRLLVAPHHLGKRHLVVNHRRRFRRRDFEGLLGRAKREFRNQARRAAIAFQSEVELAIPEPPPVVAAVLVRGIENVKQSRATASTLQLAGRSAIVRGGFVARSEKGYPCSQLSISADCQPINVNI